jgi:hypothetical protein
MNHHLGPANSTECYLRVRVRIAWAETVIGKGGGKEPVVTSFKYARESWVLRMTAKLAAIRWSVRGMKKMKELLLAVVLISRSYATKMNDKRYLRYFVIKPETFFPGQLIVPTLG